jgi:phage shock protein PspC (stress-responsive transcriptional regulator)
MVPPAAGPYRARMSLTEAEQEPLPPPDPPAHAVVHRVYRSQHRIVAGVAGGLSNAVGVAPMWGRLAFVVLTLFGGLGIALYVAAWLLLPAGPTAPTPGLPRRVLGLALVPLWLLAVGGGGRLLLVRGPAGLVLALIGVAVALWTPRSAPEPAVTAAGPLPAAVTDPPPPRPRSPLGRLTLGLALLVAAAGTAVSGGSPTGVKVAFGLAALLCGVGLVVGAWVGWARWLIVPALIFAGVSVAGAAAEGLGVHLNGSDGTSFWGPHDPTRPTPPTHLDQTGGVHLQLEDIQHPVNGVIRVGVGTVRIDAANDVRLEIHARVGLGRIDLPTGATTGYRREASYRGGPADAPLVRYDIAVGFGDVDVHRYDPAKGPVTIPSPAVPRPGVVGEDGAGGLLYENGAHQLADGTILLPDGSEIYPTGGRVFRSETRVLPSGVVVLDDGTQVEPDGSVTFPDGLRIQPVPPGSPSPTTVPSKATAPTAPTVTSVPVEATAPTAPTASTTVPASGVPQP